MSRYNTPFPNFIKKPVLDQATGVPMTVSRKAKRTRTLVLKLEHALG